MKKLIVLGLITVFVLSFIGCPDPPPPPPPPVVVDTTPPPVEVDTTPPEPPPPPPTLKQSQLQTVYFDFDKHNLRSDAKAALDVNYDLMMEFPDAIIKIEGHCDVRGTVEYNQSLGEKRARSAMEYLTGRGVPDTRLSIISYGKERLADPGKTEEAHQRNRRCEFKIISQ
jgi:peptidoglycan-associated lipoprotein